MSLFRPNASRVDDLFGALTRRFDFLEYDKFATLETQMASHADHQKHTSTSFMLMENRMSLLQAKLSSIQGMQTKQAHEIETLTKLKVPSEKLIDLSEVLPVIATPSPRRHETDLMQFVEFHERGEPLLPGISSPDDDAAKEYKERRSSTQHGSLEQNTSQVPEVRRLDLLGTPPSSRLLTP